MKSKWFIVSFVFLASLAYATKQTQKVPEKAKQTLGKMYPNAANVKWDNEDDEWEAEFKQNNTDMAVTFDLSGNLKETEEGCAVNKLPQPVRDYIAAHFAGKKIKESAKITEAGGRIKYEAEIEGKDYLFDSDGKPVK